MNDMDMKILEHLVVEARHALGDTIGAVEIFKNALTMTCNQFAGRFPASAEKFRELTEELQEKQTLAQLAPTVRDVFAKLVDLVGRLDDKQDFAIIFQALNRMSGAAQA